MPTSLDIITTFTISLQPEYKSSEQKEITNITKLFEHIKHL